MRQDHFGVRRFIAAVEGPFFATVGDGQKAPNPPAPRLAGPKAAINRRTPKPPVVEMLKHDFPAGSRVKIDFADGEFSFEREE